MEREPVGRAVSVRSLVLAGVRKRAIRYPGITVAVSIGGTDVRDWSPLHASYS